MVTLQNIKDALGITGTFQDATLQVYFDEVKSFLNEAGIPDAQITAGIMARGVADLWNYGGAEGKLSDYFMKRASQLSLK